MINGAVWVSGLDSVNPLWVDVGNTSAGTKTTQPNGKDFALTAASPAIGFLLPETYIPAATRDSGACDRSFTVCP